MQNGKQERVKAGYHHEGGVLPFALHPPILCVSGQSLRTCVHGQYARTQEKEQVPTYRGCSFGWRYGILGSTNRE